MFFVDIAGGREREKNRAQEREREMPPELPSHIIRESEIKETQQQKKNKGQRGARRGTTEEGKPQREKWLFTGPSDGPFAFARGEQ